MTNKAEEVFIAGFNNVLKSLLEEAEEIGVEFEFNDEQTTEYVYLKLNNFYERIQYYYFAEIEITEKNHQHERSLEISFLMAKASELEDELDEMNMKDFGVFLKLYDPETSVDIFGTINSSRKV